MIGRLIKEIIILHIQFNFIMNETTNVVVNVSREERKAILNSIGKMAKHGGDNLLNHVDGIANSLRVMAV